VTAADKAHNSPRHVLDARRDPNSWDRFKAGPRRQRLVLLRMHQTLQPTACPAAAPASCWEDPCGRSSPARPYLRLTPHRHRPAVGRRATRSDRWGSCRAEAGPWLDRAAQQDHLKREVGRTPPKPRFLTRNASMFAGEATTEFQGRATSRAGNEELLLDPPLQDGSQRGSGSLQSPRIEIEHIPPHPDAHVPRMLGLHHTRHGPTPDRSLSRRPIGISDEPCLTLKNCPQPQQTPCQRRPTRLPIHGHQEHHGRTPRSPGKSRQAPQKPSSAPSPWRRQPLYEDVKRTVAKGIVTRRPTVAATALSLAVRRPVWQQAAPAKPPAQGQNLQQTAPPTCFEASSGLRRPACATTWTRRNTSTLCSA